MGQIDGYVSEPRIAAERGEAFIPQPIRHVRWQKINDGSIFTSMTARNESMTVLGKFGKKLLVFKYSAFGGHAIEG